MVDCPTGQAEGMADEGLPAAAAGPSGPASGSASPSQSLPSQSSAAKTAVGVAEMVREHSAALYRYAYRLTGSTADAEDLTQQTFLIAHRKVAQLRELCGARRWLFTIMRRAYLRTVCSRDFRARRLAAPLDVDRLPAEVADEWEIDGAELQAAIDQLPDDYKLVLLSFYFEDRSYREIAAEFGLPIGTVMSRLSRAKAHLRSRLFDDELQTAPQQAAPRGAARAWCRDSRRKGEA
jgi:RNA polymerase sigma-70 factor, ECF subfamily